jgi:hypothetical protein
MAEVAEKDPELAAKIQASVDAGVPLEEAIADNEDQIKDVGVDTRSTAEKVFDTASPLGWAKQAGEGLMDWATTTEEEATSAAAMDTAKESGLYEKVGMFGDSKIDKSKLEAASINELKAILADDDLNNDDRVSVEKALEQKRADVAAGIEATKQGDAEIETAAGDAGIPGADGTVAEGAINVVDASQDPDLDGIDDVLGTDGADGAILTAEPGGAAALGQMVAAGVTDAGTIDSAILPTADAIENMTDVAAQSAEDNPPAVVVANQPAPAAPAPASDDGPNIAMMPPRVRTSDSVIQRYQDKRFRI